MTAKPIEVVNTAVNAGCYKCKISTSNMLIRGFMAGLYIAVGGALATICATGAVSPGMTKIILGAVFPVGLIAIVLTGMELFTGDAMIGPMAAMRKKVKWMAVMKLWLFVYIGNFIGSIFWAYMMYTTTLSAHGELIARLGADGKQMLDATGNPLMWPKSGFGQFAVKIAEGKVAYGGLAGFKSFWVPFMSGIACNLLVNVAILLSFSSKNMIGKFFGIWFPIMAFVSSGFEHCVANMYFIPAGIFCGANVSWGQFFGANLIPVTLGNIVGGFFFIGVIYFTTFKNEFPKD